MRGNGGAMCANIAKIVGKALHVKSYARIELKYDLTHESFVVIVVSYVKTVVTGEVTSVITGAIGEMRGKIDNERAVARP